MEVLTNKQVPSGTDNGSAWLDVKKAATRISYTRSCAPGVAPRRLVTPGDGLGDLQMENFATMGSSHVSPITSTTA
jgi:hypothetical protein